MRAIGVSKADANEIRDAIVLQHLSLVRMRAGKKPQGMSQDRDFPVNGGICLSLTAAAAHMVFERPARRGAQDS